MVKPGSCNKEELKILYLWYQPQKHHQQKEQNTITQFVDNAQSFRETIPSQGITCGCFGLSVPSSKCKVCQEFIAGEAIKHARHQKKYEAKRRLMRLGLHIPSIKESRQAPQQFSPETKKCLAYLRKRSTPRTQKTRAGKKKKQHSVIFID